MNDAKKENCKESRAKGWFFGSTRLVISTYAIRLDARLKYTIAQFSYKLCVIILAYFHSVQVETLLSAKFGVLLRCQSFSPRLKNIFPIIWHWARGGDLLDDFSNNFGKSTHFRVTRASIIHARTQWLDSFTAKYAGISTCYAYGTNWKKEAKLCTPFTRGETVIILRDRITSAEVRVRTVRTTLNNARWKLILTRLRSWNNETFSVPPSCLFFFLYFDCVQYRTNGHYIAVL